MGKENVTEKCGVSLNTLSKYIKYIGWIKTFKQNYAKSFYSGDNNLARKRVKIGKYQDVSAALLKLFTSKLAQEVVISDPLQTEKAH